MTKTVKQTARKSVQYRKAHKHGFDQKGVALAWFARKYSP